MNAYDIFKNTFRYLILTHVKKISKLQMLCTFLLNYDCDLWFTFNFIAEILEATIK